MACYRDNFTFCFYFSSIVSFRRWVVVSDRLCGLVVRDPGYRSRGPSSLPGTTKFSEK
jgi:hypothetical protein